MGGRVGDGEKRPSVRVLQGTEGNFSILFRILTAVSRQDPIIAVQAQCCQWIVDRGRDGWKRDPQDVSFGWNQKDSLQKGSSNIRDPPAGIGQQGSPDLPN